MPRDPNPLMRFLQRGARPDPADLQIRPDAARVSAAPRAPNAVEGIAGLLRRIVQPETLGHMGVDAPEGERVSILPPLIPEGVLRGAGGRVLDHLVAQRVLTPAGREILSTAAGVGAKMIEEFHPVDVAGGPIFGGARGAAKGADFILERHMPRQVERVVPSDPGMRTGVRGAEDARRANADVADDFLPRSNWYQAGTEPEVGVSAMPFVATARIPMARMYDVSEDPLRLYAKAKADGTYLVGPNVITQLEKEVVDAGFAGFYASHNPKLFSILEDVEPQHWRRRGEAAPAVDALEGFGIEHVPGEDMISRIVRDTNDPGIGGATYDPRTGQNLFGQDRIAVAARPGDDMVIPARGETGELKRSDLFAFKARHHDDLLREGHEIGTWMRPDGSIALDVARTFPEAQGTAALRLAAKNDQDAAFHLGRGEEVHIPAPFRADVRAAEGLKARNIAQTRAEAERGMTPEHLKEFRGMSKTGQRSTLESYLRAPTPDAIAQASLEGSGQRGWYEEATRAITSMFGDDAPRFTALLAATSPQAPVQRNLEVALQIWDNWVRGGRQVGTEAIEAALVKGPVGTGVFRDGVLKTFRAKDAELLEKGVDFLSGPKVSPFHRNLMGDVQQVTLDTHMARGFGAGSPSLRSRHIAMSAATRNAASRASELTGELVTPREIQETGWGWHRAMKAVRGNAPLAPRPEDIEQGRKVVDIFRARDKGMAPKPGSNFSHMDVLKTGETPKGGDRIHRTVPGTMEDPAGTFHGSLQSPEVSELLQRMGLKMPDPVAPRPARTAEVAPSTQGRHLRDLADRMDRYDAKRYLFDAAPLLGGGAAAGVGVGLQRRRQEQDPGSLWQ